MKRFFHKLSVFAASFIGAALALLLVSGVCYALIVNGNLTLAANSGSGQIIFQSGGLTTRGTVTAAGSWNLQNGALTTNATDGFTYLPSSAGTPTGVPTGISGGIPFEVDTTGHLMYMRENGSWKLIGPLTAGSNITISAAGVITATGAGSSAADWRQSRLSDAKTALSLTDGSFTSFYEPFNQPMENNWVNNGGVTATETLASANGILHTSGTSGQQGAYLGKTGSLVATKSTVLQINVSWYMAAYMGMNVGTSTSYTSVLYTFDSPTATNHFVQMGAITGSSATQYVCAVKGNGSEVDMLAGTRNTAMRLLECWYTAGDTTGHFRVDGGTATTASLTTCIGAATDKEEIAINNNMSGGGAWTVDDDEFIVVTALQ